VGEKGELNSPRRNDSHNGLQITPPLLDQKKETAGFFHEAEYFEGGRWQGEHQGRRRQVDKVHREAEVLK